MSCPSPTATSAGGPVSSTTASGGSSRPTSWPCGTAVAVRSRSRCGWAAGGPRTASGLRSASGSPVRIVTAEGERQVGDVDRARAPEQVHAGASYLHQGQHWRVVDLDLEVGVARVEPDDGATYTVARRGHADPAPRGRRRARGRAERACTSASAEVHTTVVGYQRKDALTGALVHTEALDLPTSTLVTRAIWYVVGHDAGGRGGDRSGPAAGCAPRHRARRHRDAPAVRDLRPLGRRAACPPPTRWTPSSPPS